MAGLLLPIVAASAVSVPPAAWAQGPVRAEANDQRTPAGRMVDGELRVDLVAVEGEWFPRGPEGPPVVTPAFAEAGRAPQLPGPLIRASTGTPIRVGVRNDLERPILVLGLADRASMDSPGPIPGFPAFAFHDPLMVPPGQTRETRFTPTAPVSSFYYARVLPPGIDAGEVPALPFGRPAEGAFLGALVIDGTGVPPPEDERVFVITHWSSPTEPADVTFKVMMNGLSWPFTERLTYAVGDTVHWRVINASGVEHPMHLHGFHFRVDALGDTQADTTFPPPARPFAVTQTMAEFSALRLTWVPERAGNWLFHCHLVRHMDQVQQFTAERALHRSRAHPPPGRHHLDGMAGLITGITVQPPPGGEAPDPPPARTIHLWTGTRPDVYDGRPELGFVVQEGEAPPAPDSTHVPGSPLVLTRGEPTEIVVHNRLGIPLSVHWHGLELRSAHDGVGDWSGLPGATTPPIAPDTSSRVLITPVRAGTFMYHTHGEAGHELAQGLYGPFLVLEPGERRDPETDRVFVLAGRGARRDPAPAVNGRTRPAPERFEPGRTYRLRFLQISPDEGKAVRLLRDGEPVRWRPLARDGADLPKALREARAASFELGVGETLDVEWTPGAPGVHVLEVTTRFYPVSGASVVQRVAFAVGDLPKSELTLPQGANLPVVPLSPEERRRYQGTYAGPFSPGGPAAGGTPPDIWEMRVWESRDRLNVRFAPRNRDHDGGPFDFLLPMGEHSFMPTLDLDGLLMEPIPLRVRFLGQDEGFDRVELWAGEQLLAVLARETEALR
jgi:manganese oxidase